MIWIFRVFFLGVLVTLLWYGEENPCNQFNQQYCSSEQVAENTLCNEVIGVDPSGNIIYGPCS